jgi:hypothetical protein
MELNYQQILAEVYEDNSKNVLVYQNEYDDEELPSFDDHNYDANSLPDPEEFNKFGGDRGKPEHVIQPPKKDSGIGLASIKKDNEFRMNVVNIDGQFRSNVIPGSTTDCQGNIILGTSTTAIQSGSNFAFRTARQYNNVYSVEITSIEFPNNFYTFSSSRGNTSFTIVYPTYNINTLLTIPDGNYTNIVNTSTLSPYLPVSSTDSTPSSNPDISTFTGIIQQVINDNINTGSVNINDYIKINYNSNIHKIYFSGSVNGSTTFTIIFPSTETNSFGNGIGYNLGILNQNITSSPQQLPKYYFSISLQTQAIIADTFPDTIQDTYIYLKLSDWDLITHQNPNQTSFTAFLKIPLTAPKYTMQFDNNSLNTTSKKYVFHQPTNISLIVITLLDAYGNPINLQFSTFSITLQIQEVLSKATYETLLENT